MEPSSLTEAEYVDHLFEGDEHSGELVRGVVFESCRFRSCRFGGTRFENCRLVDCTFEDCDLSLTGFPGCRLQEVVFRRSKLVGVDWRLVESIRLTHFEECALDDASFSGLVLGEARLTKCTARNADFIETDLTGADLRETDFEGARFLAAVLAKADLRGARNYVIDARSNDVRGARFQLPEAVSLLRSLEIDLDE